MPPNEHLNLYFLLNFSFVIAFVFRFMIRIFYRRLTTTTKAAMTAQKIDGTAIAKSIREKIHAQIQETQLKNPRFSPSLAIIQVGNRPDSTSYVTMKAKAAADAMITFQHIKMPEETSEAAVMTCPPLEG